MQLDSSHAHAHWREAIQLYDMRKGFCVGIELEAAHADSRVKGKYRRFWLRNFADEMKRIKSFSGLVTNIKYRAQANYFHATIATRPLCTTAA